jgi:hypothetical protein
MLAATAGPALAISGSSSSGNVPSAEYPDNDAKKSDNLGGSTSAGGGSDKGGIPYTGFAIVVLAGLGVLAVTGGVSMRRAARDE